MRSLVLILLLVGSAHGFLGTIGNLINTVGNTVQSAANQIGQTVQSATNQLGQTVSSLWNGATNQINNVVGGVNSVIGNVVDSAGNVYGQLVSTANGVQFAANFLWDNVFGPAFDMMVEGGQLFLDDKFGNIVATIGRRSVVSENVLSEKFAELIAVFKTNVHQLYDQLFQLEREALLALQNGEKSLEASIRAFYARIADIENQVKQWAAEAKYALQAHAQTVQGDWVHILSQYSQNIDFSAQTLVGMLQRLAEDLLKNLVDVALNVVPNALAIVDNLKQQGLLSFFHH